jgi:hypothetical protein
VSGPPGIGKTRLTERVCADFAARGALVRAGRAREGEGVPALWPFAQVLRGLLEDPTAAEATREVAKHAGELGELLGLRASGARTAEPNRFLLFDAVSRTLQRIARRRPLVIVLEDVQWAGAESLQLLEHLAYEPIDAPLLVLATVRLEPRAPGDPVARALSLLRAQDACTEVALAPLTREEVTALLEQALGRTAPADLTAELFARTEGVPLFVREAIRLFEEGDAFADPAQLARAEIALPARALDLIRRPLEQLTPAATELIAAAAVLGREFELLAASAVAGQSRSDALDHVDQAVLAGVLGPATTGAAVFRFAHALFREAALAALSPGRRARLHLRAAEHLERENEGDPTAVLAELAHHHYCALPVGDPERACEAALRAAQHAARLGAHDQAAQHTEQAREAFEQVPGLDPERRLELALACTEAWQLASERSRRRRSARTAFDLARALGRPREMARAAIGLLDLQEWGVHDETARAAIEQALAALGNAAPVEEARLVTRLAYLEVQTAPERAAPVARRAVEIARAAGNPDALQDALYTLHFSLGGPEGHGERAALADEIAAVASASRSADRALIALLDVSSDRFECGDRAGALRLRETARRIGGERPHLGMRWHLAVHDTGVALLEGRLDEVEPLAREALSVGLRAEHPYALGCFAVHSSLLARARGDHALVIERLTRALRTGDGPIHWLTAVVARSELAVGRTADARARWDELAARAFRDVPRNLRWTASLVECAHLCAELGDAARGAQLEALLAPHADLHAVMPIAICYGGPVRHALARLAALRGATAESRALLRTAIEDGARLGAAPLGEDR